jgi:hypothetical protein
MPIQSSSTRIDATRLAALAGQLLDASPLCAIASTSPDGRPHINTAYFAWSRSLEIIWLSDPDAWHSRNVRAGADVAIAVHDSRQTWGGSDRGIQLFGPAEELDEVGRAAALYARRFDGFIQAELGGYHFYQCTTRTVKLFAEGDLGAGTFVTARVVDDGRLEWERTEIYRPEG